MRFVAATLAIFVAACGPRRAPPVDAESFLAVGVDARAECDAERDALAREGLAVIVRVDEPGVCAVGLATPDRRRTAVRVVTGRGVQLARDGLADGIPPSPAVSLVPLPAGTPLSREVLVGRADRALDRVCIDVVRVLADDTVRVVPVELAAIVDRVAIADDLCVEQVRDVDGDGRVEALVVVRLSSLARTTPPVVVVPLIARGEALAPALALVGYWDAERARHAVALAHARSAVDVDGAYTLAVELAAIALLAGDGRDAAVNAYDEALRGLVLTEPQSRFLAATRASLARGLPPATP